MVVHLLPEQLARTCRIGIIEGAEIAWAYPVLDLVFDGLLINPSLGIECLVIVGRGIVFGPMGDEDAGMVVMDKVDHPLGIGEALLVELETAPLVLLPIEPVLHDIVDRNLPFTELGERGLHLFLTVVFLTALPETKGPLGHHLCPSREKTVALDNLIIIISGDEVVVHLLVHLSPDRDTVLFLFALRLGYTQSAISHTTVGLPLDAQRRALALLQVYLKLIGIGIPSRAPALRHHQTSAHIHLDIAGIIEDETVFGRSGSLDVALIDHVGVAEVELLRQVAHHSRMFIIDGVFGTLHNLARILRISAREGTTATVLVVEGKGTMELQVIVGIAPATIGIGVPEDAIVLGAHHKGDRHFGVILEQFLVASLVVHLFGLMLSQSVERLPGIAFEKGTPTVTGAVVERELVEIILLPPVDFIGRGRHIVGGQFGLR